MRTECACSNFVHTIIMYLADTKGTGIWRGQTFDRSQHTEIGGGGGRRAGGGEIQGEILGCLSTEHVPSY